MIDEDGQAEIRKVVGLSSMTTMDALDADILESLVQASIAVRRTAGILAEREVPPKLAQSFLLGAVLSIFTQEYGDL